jgi:hypothetical protein
MLIPESGVRLLLIKTTNDIVIIPYILAETNVVSLFLITITKNIKVNEPIA